MSSIYHDILGRERRRDAPAIIGNKTLIYSDLLSLVDVISEALAKRGLAPGSRVGLCLDQGAEYLAGLLAVRKAGGLAVLLAPDWTDGEKARVMDEANCRFALADFPVLAADEGAPPLPIGETEVRLFTYAVEETLSAEPDDAVLLFSSGTTGVPKGVVLSESAVSANVRAVARYLELTPDDGAPVFTPPCYAYSLSQNLVTAWSGGRLMPVPAGLMFPVEILRSIAQHRLTGMSATPTAYRLLCQLDPGEEIDLSSVRYAMAGGQFLDPHLVGLMGSLVPNARVVNMYGCSENAPRISYHVVSGRAGLSPLGTYPVGRPVEGTEIQIVSESGDPVVPGEVGEVVIRGSSLMRAYWNDPEATAERVVDGWFHTKDLGYLDADKQLHLSGRLSIVINIGNEKVSPEEVEGVIRQVDGVADAAVYGQKDPVLGETAAALVVTEPGHHLMTADIQRHCRRALSGFKVPRTIEVVDELPRTHYGKIDRAALAKRGTSLQAKGTSP